MEDVLNKILDGSLNLNTLTLEEFNEGREVYSTYLKAKKLGFEADHIHTSALQIKRYNAEHNTSYKTSERLKFAKETGCFDDSCYRMTALEHIINHYLKAKEDPEEAEIFYHMLNHNKFKLSELENITLEQCVEFARLREEGKKKSADNHRGKPWKHKGKTMKEITGNPDFVSPKKGHTLKEHKKDPNWVNPIKGKTMQEITGDPNWVSSHLGKTMKELTGNPNWVDPKKGKTKAEIVGDPNYVNPRLGKKNSDYNPNYVNKHKGKTMKEITGNLNYVDHKLGKTMKEITGNSSWEYKWKGKSMKEKTRNPDYTAWNKGVPNTKAKVAYAKRVEAYRQEKATGTFQGNWNEYQTKCRLEGLFKPNDVTT